MSKIYIFILSCCFVQLSFAQCPVINGAMVNSCAPVESNQEGVNEFVFFTTGAAGAVSLYELDYGSNPVPSSVTPTGIMSGTTVGPKTGAGTITIPSGCTLHEVSSPSTVIPANSSVVFIPAVFNMPYDMSALCKDGNLYVVYVTITSPSKWPANGTLANGAAATRYIQIRYNGNVCSDNIRAYDGALWPVAGVDNESDGNSLVWDAEGNTLYLNNGCTNITTPVKLVAFNATQKGKDVTVTWKTASEINSKSFEVEWSTDGVIFSAISTVNATGNSDVSTSYSFIDKNITTGNNFYRLKTLDADGKFSYSAIVKVNFSGAGQIKIYPQVTTSDLKIELNALKQGQTTAQVYDHIGRLITSKNLSVVAGYNQLNLNVNSLPSGGYILKLLNNNQINVSRFTKL